MWIGILYVVLGFVIIALCFPLLAGRVRRNRWYGFRIPKAYESEDAWQRINSYGARHMIRWASALMGFGAFLIIAPDAGQSVVMGIMLGAPLLLLIPIAQTYWYAKRLP